MALPAHPELYLGGRVCKMRYYISFSKLFLCYTVTAGVVKTCVEACTCAHCSDVGKAIHARVDTQGGANRAVCARL